MQYKNNYRGFGMLLDILQTEDSIAAMFFQIRVLLAITCTTCLQVDSEKILMFPAAGKSHVLDQACLAEELASRGNEVYFIVHEDLQFSAALETLQAAQIIALPRESYAGLANT